MCLASIRFPNPSDTPPIGWKRTKGMVSLLLLRAFLEFAEHVAELFGRLANSTVLCFTGARLAGGFDLVGCAITPASASRCSRRRLASLDLLLAAGDVLAQPFEVFLIQMSAFEEFLLVPLQHLV